MVELLEREELLAQLDAFRAEGGHLLFVGGEAGVGKTALVRAFAAGNAALHGSCENLTTPTPFGPFFDIGIDVAGEPRQLAATVLAALEQTPLLVLEDVHWADQATLDVLRVLGRRIGGTRALVLATYRDDEVVGDHPLRVVLGELTSAEAVSRLAVPRLSLAAVRALAEPEQADAEAIHRLTQGNAFYVTEILAAGGGSLPDTVRDAVLARTARLDPAARQLLEVVSVIPARAELSLLEAVAAKELEQLDACLASGVLRADGDGVRFRHELARLAVESAVPTHRRRALHAEIVKGLEPMHDLSRLAHHAEEAGDSATVLVYAPEAARRAADASAHREAAAQYARALRHAGTLTPAERAQLLNDYALETSLTGRFSESIAARREAVEIHRELGDRLGEASALAKLTFPLIATGANAAAEESSRAAITVLEELPLGPELAAAYATQAYARMLSRDNADGVSWGEKAAVAAESSGDLETLAFALNMIGTSYLMGGEIDRGIEYLLRSLELARREQLERHIGSALGMLGSGLGEMYELDRSETWLREHLAFAAEHDVWPFYSRAWLSLVHVYRGRWEEGPLSQPSCSPRSPSRSRGSAS